MPREKKEEDLLKEAFVSYECFVILGVKNVPCILNQLTDNLASGIYAAC